MRAASGACSSSAPAARRASTASPSPSAPATARPCSASRSSRSYSLRPGSIRYAASSVSNAGTTPASQSAPPNCLKLCATIGLAPAASAGVAALLLDQQRLLAARDARAARRRRPRGRPGASAASSAAQRGGVAALARRPRAPRARPPHRGRPPRARRCGAAARGTRSGGRARPSSRGRAARPAPAAGSTSSVEVALDRRQQLRALGVLAVLDQRLPALLARHRVDVRVDALERAEAHEQVGRGLVADAGHAGDVVGGVALEPDEVGHEPRRDAVAGLDALGRVDVHVGHAARRQQHADVVGDELEGVAVVRDHAGRDALLVGAQAERADHVVGLVALELDVAVAERLDERAQVRLLLLEQRRRRLARGLVAREALEAVHGPRVPGHDHALRVVVREQPHEHVREAEQRVRRESVGRRELLGKRVVGPVGERVAVDQEQPRGARGPSLRSSSEGLATTAASCQNALQELRAVSWRNGAAARYCVHARACRHAAVELVLERDRVRAGRRDLRLRDAEAADLRRSISCASSPRPTATLEFTVASVAPRSDGVFALTRARRRAAERVRAAPARWSGACARAPASTRRPPTPAARWRSTCPS